MNARNVAKIVLLVAGIFNLYTYNFHKIVHNSMTVRPALKMLHLKVQHAYVEEDNTISSKNV